MKSTVCTCHRCECAHRTPEQDAGPPGPRSQALHLRSNWLGACACCHCLLKQPAASWLPAGRLLQLMGQWGHAARRQLLRARQAHSWLRLRLQLRQQYRHAAAEGGRSCHQVVTHLQWAVQALLRLLPQCQPAVLQCCPAAAAECPAPRRHLDRLPAGHPPLSGWPHAPPAHRQQRAPGRHDPHVRFGTSPLNSNHVPGRSSLKNPMEPALLGSQTPAYH